MLALNRIFERRFGQLAVLTSVLILGVISRAAEPGYLDNAALAKSVKQIEKDAKGFVHLSSLGQSQGKQELWTLTVGQGQTNELAKRPALLVVAGLDGTDLLGTSCSLRWITNLLAESKSNPATSNVLQRVTIYVVPRASPDAADGYFAKPRKEIQGTRTPADADHDGLLDEDGPEDLDNNGVISQMRIADPEGGWMLDPNDTRLLMKPDKLKGERGEYRLLSEGRDNDHDDKVNEDPGGLVSVNRNFPYNYAFFAPSAGIFPLSEIEARSLADFVVSHPNIAAVFSFGGVDNLSTPLKGEARGNLRKPRTLIQEEDTGLYREFSKQWRDTIQLKKELPGATEPGTFADWIYYHRGRLSLSARAWWPALQVEWNKGNTNTPASTNKIEDTRNDEDRAFVKWLQATNPAAFLPWKQIAHPDFTNDVVEVGGFTAFAKLLPPESSIPSIADKTSRFLTDLAGKLPRLRFGKIEFQALGNSVFRLKVAIENAGYLPTSLAQGDVSREVFKTRLVLDAPTTNLLAGVKTTLIGPIDGSGGRKEFEFTLLHPGKEPLKIEVISACSGIITTNLPIPTAVAP